MPIQIFNRLLENSYKNYFFKIGTLFFKKKIFYNIKIYSEKKKFTKIILLGLKFELKVCCP